MQSILISCFICAYRRYKLKKGKISIMNINMKDKYIPGTRVSKDEMHGITGKEFLDKIFFMSDGIMLNRIRDIAGIDGSTIQNWVKRGWLGSTVNKRYSEVQLARILIINMLRTTMKLEKIDFLLHYINGNLDNRADDIISEPILYEYICKITDRIDGSESVTPDQIREIIFRETSGYEEQISGAADRLRNALEVILLSYFASIVSSYSEEKFSAIKSGKTIFPVQI